MPVTNISLATVPARALFAVRAVLGARDDVALEGSYAQDGDPLRFDIDAPHRWHWTLAVPAPADRTADAVTTAAARFGAPVGLRAHAEQRVAHRVERGRRRCTSAPTRSCRWPAPRCWNTRGSAATRCWAR